MPGKTFMLLEGESESQNQPSQWLDACRETRGQDCKVVKGCLLHFQVTRHAYKLTALPTNLRTYHVNSSISGTSGLVCPHQQVVCGIQDLPDAEPHSDPAISCAVVFVEQILLDLLAAI